MLFDNKQFEREAKTSMSTVEKLKQSLKFDGITKGLDNLGQSFKRVDVGSLGVAVETVTHKFSTLEVMAISALQRITQKAVDTGIQFVKSLSFDNINAGWQKFGEKTTSVGTLISQGYDIDTVTAQLERLNWFTDETSYNFVDMVSNIAKFTASGQDLEKSVTALEGIANWAALSGQNASTASRAMYQLSQAMGSGIMRKEDYKSIQNVSMDTDEFRQKALDAAVALGTLKKTGKDTYQSLMENTDEFTKSQFADHLTKDAWFTSDVMMKVFNDYSAAVDQIYEYAEEKGITASEAIEQLGDSVDAFGLKAFKAAQEARTWTDVLDSVKDAVSTSWMTTFELIFGNYEEAKSLWTTMANELYDVFMASSEVRNEILESWRDLGGREKLLQALSNAWEALKRVLESVKTAISEVFPSMTGSKLFTLTGLVEKFTEKLLNMTDATKTVTSTLTFLTNHGPEKITNTFEKSNETMDKFHNTVKNVFESIRNIFEGFKNAIDTVKYVIQDLIPTDILGKAQTFTGFIKDLTEKFKELTSMKKVTVSELIFQTNHGEERITETFYTMKDSVEKIRQIVTGIGTAFSLVKDFVVAIVRGLFPLKETVADVGGGLLNLGVSFSDLVSKWRKKADDTGFFATVTEKVSGAITKIQEFRRNAVDAFEKAIEKIKEFGQKVEEVFTNLIGKSPKEVFENLKTSVSGAYEKVKEFFEGLKTGGSEGVESLKEKLEPLKSLFEGIKSVFSGLWEILKHLMPALSNIATAIGETLKQVGSSLKNSFTGENALDNILKTVGTGALVGVLASIKKAFGNLSDVGEGIEKVLSKVKGVLSSFQTELNAKALLKIASAIAILTASLLVLSTIPSDKLLEAGGAVAVMFGGLQLTLEELSTSMGKANGSNLKKLATTMLVMAAAILVLSFAMKKLADLEWDELAKGALGIGSLTVIMVEASKHLKDNTDDLTKGAVGMIAFAIAMQMLVKPVRELGALDIKTLAKGIGAIGLLIIELAAFLQLSDFKDFGVGDGLGLIAVAGAITILSNAVGKFADMDWKQMLRGITGVGLVMAELAVFVNVVGEADHILSTAVAMLAIAASMEVFADVVKKFGDMEIDEILKGLITMGAVLTEVSVAAMLANGSAGGAAAILIMGAALAVLTPCLKALGKMPLADIGKGLLAIAGVFTIFGAAAFVLQPVIPAMLGLAAAVALLGAGMAAAGVGVLAFSAGLAAMAATGSAAITLLTGAIKAILALVPDIARGIGEGLITILQTIAEFSEELRTAVGQIVVALLGVITDTADEIKTAILTLIDIALTAVSESVQKIVNTALDLITALLQAIADHTPEFVQAGMDFLINFLQGIADNIGAVTEAVFNIITNFLDAVAEKVPDLIDSGGDIIIAFIQGIGEKSLDVIDAATQTVIDFVNGLAQGIEDHTEEMVQALRNLGKAMLDGFLSFFGIHSPSTVMAEKGEYLVDGLNEGMNRKKGSAIDTIQSVGSSIIDGFKRLFKIDSKDSTVMADNGEAMVDGLISGSENGKSEASKSMTGVGEAMVEGFKENDPKFTEAGSNSVKMLIEGVTKQVPESKNTMTELGNNMVDTFDKIKENFKRSGMSIVTCIIDGVKAQFGNAQNVMSNLANAMLSQFNSFAGQFSAAGQNVTAGLVSGAQANTSAAQSAGRRLGEAMLDGTSSYLEIRSPSRAMMRLGKLADEGLVIGIKRFLPLIGSASEEAGESATSPIQDAIKKISDDLNSEPDWTIKPILDLSSITEGVSKMNGMIGTSRSLGLAGQISYKMNDNASISARNAVDTSDTSSVIAELKQDMARMIDTMANFKIFLDSGVLVGEIAGPMDQALGRRAMLGGRGIQ